MSSLDQIKSVLNTGPYILPFGKYKGKQLKDVEDNYLGWLFSEEWVTEDLKNKIYQEGLIRVKRFGYHGNVSDYFQESMQEHYDDCYGYDPFWKDTY